MGVERIERIREYFMNKGFVEIDEDELRHLEFKPSLAFTDGEETVFINVMPVEALKNKNELMRFIMETSALRNQCDKVYMVVPSLFATLIDSEILRRMKIGLIVLDEREIKEILPAKKSKSKILLDVEVIKEIREILSRLKVLEETVYRIESQIREIVRSGVKIQEVVIKEEVSSDLPSYMQDNPWIDILKERGRDEIG